MAPVARELSFSPYPHPENYANPGHYTNPGHYDNPDYYAYPGRAADSFEPPISGRGVLEPLQTAVTLDGQVRELKAVLKEHAALPVTLIGFSWGAMLSYIFTASHPELVKKLILVGSGPYEEKYADIIRRTRGSRLSKDGWTGNSSLAPALNNLSNGNKNASFARFGQLMSHADSYDPLPHDDEVLEYQYVINKNVWGDASKLRGNGKLLALGKKIRCPVFAIHGDYDPHPFEGVRDPLSGVLKNFRYVLLEKCGHRPWIEREAKEQFYDVLKGEI
ncbi:TPA: alpha/beta hydrolase [Methanosarcinaceae archaeon]|nr:alpha/beta hydrolase [Methanosarcinaceae archaeon]